MTESRKRGQNPTPFFESLPGVCCSGHAGTVPVNPSIRQRDKPQNVSMRQNPGSVCRRVRPTIRSRTTPCTSCRFAWCHRKAPFYRWKWVRLPCSPSLGCLSAVVWWDGFSVVAGSFAQPSTSDNTGFMGLLSRFTPSLRMHALRSGHWPASRSSAAPRSPGSMVTVIPGPFFPRTCNRVRTR